MIVTGLDGREYVFKPVSTEIKENCSEYHKKAREILRKIYPNDRILEEVWMPGLERSGFADFYLPLRKLIVEVQGEQHYNYIPYFHGDVMEYLRSRGRDVNKKKWCEINEIRFVELPYDKIDTWAELICG